MDTGTNKSTLTLTSSIIYLIYWLCFSNEKYDLNREPKLNKTIIKTHTLIHTYWKQKASPCCSLSPQRTHSFITSSVEALQLITLASPFNLSSVKSELIPDQYEGQCQWLLAHLNKYFTAQRKRLEQWQGRPPPQLIQALYLHYSFGPSRIHWVSRWTLHVTLTHTFSNECMNISTPTNENYNYSNSYSFCPKVGPRFVPF